MPFTFSMGGRKRCAPSSRPSSYTQQSPLLALTPLVPLPAFLSLPLALYHMPSACVKPVGIKDGKRSMEPRNFLRVGEGIEARKRAGKRPQLPKIGHYGSGYGGFGGSGGGGLRQKGGAGLERSLQILPTRCPDC